MHSPQEIKKNEIFKEKCQVKKIQKIKRTEIEEWDFNSFYKLLKTLKYDHYVVETVLHFPSYWFYKMQKIQIKRLVHHIIHVVDFSHFKKILLKHILNEKMYCKSILKHNKFIC